MEEDPKSKSLSEYHFTHEDETICGVPVSPITEEYIENYPSVVDRFFTRYYYLKAGTRQEPYMVLFHSNRICLIGLAPEHPVFAAGVSSVTFDIGNTDRSQNKVHGKGKKGGMILQADSTLAIVTGNDGATYKVPSCIRGKLVEVNSFLLNNPGLLATAEEGAGYIAIVLPKPEHCDDIKMSLLTQDQYRLQINDFIIDEHVLKKEV